MLGRAAFIVIALALASAWAAGDVAEVMNRVIGVPDTDPRATNDSFMLLTPAEQLEFLSENHDLTLSEREDRVAGVDLVVHVDVRLVGFEGDSFMGVDLDPQLILKYLDELNTDYQAHFIDGPGKMGHKLSVGTKFTFQIVKCAKKLLVDIQETLTRETEKASVVPYTVVDDIIRQDYAETGLHYSIYLLNLEPINDRSYVYSQTLNGRALKNKECGTAIWAGKERYAWVDLQAGPLHYGPKTSGAGVVSWFTVPKVDRHELETQLVADLVGLVWKTCKHLIIPPLGWFPVPDAPVTAIQFFVITEWEVQAKPRIQYEAIVQQLSQLALPGQTVSFPLLRRNLRDCTACALAYRMALKSHTSTILNDKLETHVHPYLDSAELHVQLQNMYKQIAGKDAIDDKNVRVIPVFLFDTNTNGVLLLDRFHQALSFPDMVVAVQSMVGEAFVDFTCNDKWLIADLSDCTRAMMGAILKTGWAVSPTHLTFSPATRLTESDYLWSVGHTPFGYFSNSTQLSFAIRDAALRNVVYTMLEQTLAEVRTLFSHFEIFDLELSEVFSPELHILFLQRWNVFDYKLGKAELSMALLRFDHALFYLRSLRHDVNAMHFIVHHAGQHVHSHVTCRKLDPTTGEATHHYSMEENKGWSTPEKIAAAFAIGGAVLVARQLGKRAMARIRPVRVKGD